MGSRIFAALLALDLVLLLLTWSVRALAGQPETLAQALEFWRCTDSRHYLDIARDGYIAAGDPDRVVQLVFLPGYPLVVRAVMRLVPSDICAGLLTSALCFAGAGVHDLPAAAARPAAARRRARAAISRARAGVLFLRRAHERICFCC